MGRALSDQVVVITGASQGIGRETALAVGRAGGRVVAAARNEPALRTLADEIVAAGGQRRGLVTDVADFGDMERLGARAVERFGRIDTWVNNAGTSIYARLTDTDADELERIVRVNLLGVIFGSKVALRHLAPNGAGTIINVGSVLSERGVQLQSAYVATKHGVAGFTEALRLEVKESAPGVDVVLILPSSINTRLFQNARSKLGVLPAPIPPVYEPRAVAEAICHAAEHGGREIVVGGAGKLLVLGQRLSGSLLDRYMLLGDQMVRQQETDRPDDRQDNLFEPSSGAGSSRGAFGDGAKETSIYTRELELHPMRKRALVAAALVASLVAIRKVAA